MLPYAEIDELLGHGSETPPPERGPPDADQLYETVTAVGLSRATLGQSPTRSASPPASDLGLVEDFSLAPV